MLEQAILNHVLRNVSYTSPSTVYVGLFTTAPSASTDSGTDGIEVGSFTCTLDANINNSVTSFNVSAPIAGASNPSAFTTFPTGASPNYVVVVGSEKMLVTGMVANGGGATLTVTRAYSGTSAASHSGGDTMTVHGHPATAYQRVAVTFGAPTKNVGPATGSVIKNSAQVDFAVAAYNWGTCTAAGIFDSATPGLGNVLVYGPLVSNKTVEQDDALKFLSNALSITLD